MPNIAGNIYKERVKEKLANLNECKSPELRLWMELAEVIAQLLSINSENSWRIADDSND